MGQPYMGQPCIGNPYMEHSYVGHPYMGQLYDGAYGETRTPGMSQIIMSTVVVHFKLHTWLYLCGTRQVWLGDLAREMKDTLKALLVKCVNASKKGSGGGVDPSQFPSQVNPRIRAVPLIRYRKYG